MRINQYVAATTGMSRRAADLAISDGRVLLDGRPAKLGDQASGSSLILLDGTKLEQPTNTFTYVMLNKPPGYVSSRARQGETPTLYQLLPPDQSKLRIVGRLDQESSGLILLTDDGSFVQTHTHPSFGHEKVYELTLSAALKPADIMRLETGVALTDGPARLNVLGTHGHHVTVGLSEGRNRQLRRMFGQLRYTVIRLHRIQMGKYKLGNLPEGSWKAVQGPSA